MGKRRKRSKPSARSPTQNTARYLPFCVGILKFSTRPIEVSEIPNPQLVDAAREILEEISAGQWQHVYDLRNRPPQACEEIITELRSRHSGFTRADYEAALVQAASLIRSRYSPLSTFLFRAAASAFIWGSFGIWAPIFKLSYWSIFLELCGWITLLYPFLCVAAIVYLLRTKRKGRIIFALLNAVSAITWLSFFIWLIYALAHTPRR